MARKKLEIKATPEQLNRLYAALGVGSPLTIACQTAGISLATYYYWVAIYSVVVYCREQQELEEIAELSKIGISVQEIKELSAAATCGHKKSAIGTYIEPKAESILQYKNSVSFRRFADQVFEIINRCNRIRSEVVIKHLDIINKSTETKNKYKPSGSMWFLERTQGDYFGRAQDKAIEEETTPGDIPSVTVEFVDPKSDPMKDRIAEMEERVLKELKGVGEA